MCGRRLALERAVRETGPARPIQTGADIPAAGRQVESFLLASGPRAAFGNETFIPTSHCLGFRGHADNDANHACG